MKNINDSFELEDRTYEIFMEMNHQADSRYSHNIYIDMESITAEYDKEKNRNFLLSVNALRINSEIDGDRYHLQRISSKESAIGKFSLPIFYKLGIFDQEPKLSFGFPISMSFVEAILFFKNSIFGQGQTKYLSKEYVCDYAKLYKPQDEVLNPDNHLMYEFRDIRSTYTQYFYLDVTTKEILGKSVDNTDEANLTVEYTFKEI